MAKECPYCGSSNTVKTNTGDQILEGVGRFIGAGLSAYFNQRTIGDKLFVGPVQKSKYLCNSCGHEFDGDGVVLGSKKKGRVRDSVEEIVKEIIIEKLGVEESEVTMDASFTDDLGADDFDTVELFMTFEKEFGITIPDDQAELISTIGDAVAYIEANK